ncbi:MAG: hypothetical protein M3R35_00285 [Candidatus Eremiobacteraeota bacterium]|nr:hypothetical protein [Candidatus Eremiobacteraeota bacterium]
MRLVELQRVALGVDAPPRTNWSSRLPADGDEPEAIAGDWASGAFVVIELRGEPRENVIPGAIVTLVLEAVNEGGTAAAGLRIGVPLPAGAEFRAGSFMRDGRPGSDDAAAQLFGEGLDISPLSPRARTTLLWKLGVRPGSDSLVLSPFAHARAAAIAGASPLPISRKPKTRGIAFAQEIAKLDRDDSVEANEAEELPFYELDEEEQLLHSAVALPEPEPEAEHVPPAALLPAAPVESRNGVLLVGSIDRLSLAYFERLFGDAKPPTLLAHFMLGGALACTQTPDGADPAGLKAHNDAQAQLLQRIVLHERLGKKEPIQEYAGTFEASLDRLTSEPAPHDDASPADSRVLRLECDVSDPAMAVLHKMREERSAWDFTKARQVALALQARRVFAQADTEAAEAALQHYSQVSSMQLQRFFVRMRLDRTTGLLFSLDEKLDAAARRLIAALIARF